jgi:hypothetical protein
MAALQAEQIRQHLLSRLFEKDNLADAAGNEAIDDLDTFDSFHDFGDQKKTRAEREDLTRRNLLCCTSLINTVSDAPEGGFLASREIPVRDVRRRQNVPGQPRAERDRDMEGDRAGEIVRHANHVA